MKMWKSLFVIVTMGCLTTCKTYASVMNTCLNTGHWCWSANSTCDVIILNSKNQIQVFCYKSELVSSCFYNYTLTTVSPINLTSKDDSRHSLTMEYVSFSVKEDWISDDVQVFISGEEQTWFQSNETFSEIHLSGICIVEAIAAHPGIRHHDLDVSHCVYGVNLTWEMITVDGSGVSRKAVTLTTFNDVNGEKRLSFLLRCGVTALYLPDNAIGVIKSNTFPALPGLELLDLSRCRLTSIEDSAFSQLTNLKYLNLAGNHLKKIPNAVMLLPKLETLNFSHNNYPSVDRRELCKMSTLRSLDLSFNTFGYRASTFEGKEIMESLKILNMSGTRNIPGEILEMFPNLETLIWTHISPGFLEVFDVTDITSVFTLLMTYRLKQLISLDLSNSEIVEDDFNVDVLYNGYQHLRYLNLASNYLKKLPSINTGHSLNVSRVLNLSGNNIESWTEEIMNETVSSNFELDLTINNITFVSEAMIEDFSKFNAVYLSGNPFNCGNCSLFPLLDWLKKNTTKTNYHLSPYTCASPYQVKGHSFHYESLPTHCLPVHIANDSQIEIANDNRMDIPVIASLCVAAPVFILIVVVIVYWRRCRSRSKLSACRSQCVELSRAIHYDAFISYCSADCDWVVEHLIPELEQREPKLHLCIHERDFLAGGTIINNVIECIDNSRKTVFLITRRFIKSNWCQWELEMAQHKLFEEGNDVLVLVMLETLAKKQLPRLLQILVSTRTYLQWPGDSATEEQYHLFWARLRQFIGPCNCIKEQLQAADILC